MYLASLAVENFRAARSARLDFDRTTVLIGENDCGKSSLLEALAIALDPEAEGEAPRFRHWHFHRTEPHAAAPPAGPIRLVLRFRERVPGEWDALAESPLAGILEPAASGPRSILLEIQAVATPGRQESVARWRLRSENTPREAAIDSPEALDWLRRLNPLVWLHGGELVGVPVRHAKPRRQSPLAAPEVVHLAERIQQSYAEFVSGTASDIQAKLTEGFAAASEFITLAAGHLNGPGHQFRQIVAEILDQRRRLPDDEAGVTELRFTGTSAERIGVLALLATLLHATPGGLAPGAEPIWIIEDPEAQLHPMTLASVLKLVGRVNWQKIITTQSPEVLTTEPLLAVRRITRQAGTVRAWRVRPQSLSAEDLRRISYHLRVRRGVATFARCWLLVEGETEFWMVPELARMAGHDFAIEGVACVEFAQCGLSPLIKLARELGIEWHLLTDGDAAGEEYTRQVEHFLGGEAFEKRVTVLPDPDIETCFYRNGYAPVFRRMARAGEGQPDERIIRQAIQRHSKPQLALELVLAAVAPKSAGVPPVLLEAIEASIALTREEPV